MSSLPAPIVLLGWFWAGYIVLLSAGFVVTLVVLPLVRRWRDRATAETVEAVEVAP